MDIAMFIEPNRYHDIFCKVMQDIRAKASLDLLNKPKVNDGSRYRESIEKTKTTRLQLLQQYLVEDPKFSLKVESLGFNLDKITKPVREYKPRSNMIPIDRIENQKLSHRNSYNRKKAVNGLI